MPERESRVRDIATHCRPAGRLRHYLGLYGATIVLLGSTIGGPGFVSISALTKKTRSNLSYDYDSNIEYHFKHVNVLRPFDLVSA